MPPSPDDPWYAPGLSFKCTQCGNCCTGPTGFVWFNDDEARAIAEYLGITEAQFRQRYAHRKFGRWSLDEVKVKREQYDCVFLQRDEAGKALCSIYPVRPTQCRTWPFWRSNLASPDAWREAARTCPGMQQGGNFYPVEKIRIILESNPDEL